MNPSSWYTGKIGFSGLQSNRRCDICKLNKPIKLFPKQRRGKLFTCVECKPDIKLQEIIQYLQELRSNAPCVLCGELLIYWYKKTGQLCDVFKFAEEGYKLAYIKRFVSQLVPKCSACASKQVTLRSAQLIKQSEGWKRRAINTDDEVLKAEYWKRHYATQTKVVEQLAVEKLGTELDQETRPEWSPDRYGGLEDI